MLERNQHGRGRKNRTNVSLPIDYENKLKRLSIACGMPHTTMAYVLLKYCLDDPQIVANVQEEHSAHDDYRVILIRTETGWKYDVLRHNKRTYL